MTTPDLTAADDSGLAVSQEGALGLITLARPRVLNVLNSEMKERLAAAIPQFARDPQIYAVVIQSASEKAFCAGGDVRETVTLARAGIAAARLTFRKEYELIWLLECFSKPTVTLINGIVMGSGVGISAFATHRVAGERYRFAMPETAIGLFPDVGIASILACLPHQTGIYLGLTGRSILRADALKLGLVTHCINENQFADIKKGLSEAWPVDVLLDGRHQDPGAGELEAVSDVIAHCFAAATVEEIIDRLQAVTGPQREWAEGVIVDLNRRAPLSLKVTLRHIREARELDLRQTLITDYRLACRFLDDADFYEGVRAVLVDKDNAPVWQPPDLTGATDALVDRYFTDDENDVLELPPRSEMQAARV